MKKIGLFAKLALLSATLIWGTSFVIIEDTVELISPNYLMALRFTGACILLSAIFWKRLRKITIKTLWQGALIGVLLYLAYFWQTYGIADENTTPGKNAFLTAFYCVLVPFLAWMFKGPRPDKWNLIAAFMCITGIGLISLDKNFNMCRGDVFSLIGGFFFACHMVVVSKFGSDSDPILMTILQFASAAVCFWITTFVIDGAPNDLSFDVIPSVMYLCVLCTAVALLFQNFGQKHTTPSAASLILSLESVFGTIISIAVGREDLAVKMFLGFVMIFLSIVVSETKMSFLLGTKKNKGIVIK